MCSGHPFRCWPRSPLLNLRDQERPSTASQESYLSGKAVYVPSYTVRHTSPFSGKLHPEAWHEFSQDVWHLLSNGIRRSWRHPPSSPDKNHVHTRMNPHPFMATKAQSSTNTLPETGLHQTPKSLRCHHLVTCSGHPSECWPRSQLLNLRDQERHSTASPEKLHVAHWQGSINSLLYCPPQYFKSFNSMIYAGSCHSL
jgi:hypothetical protein